MGKRVKALIADTGWIMAYGALLSLFSFALQPLFTIDAGTSQAAGSMMLVLPVVLFFAYAESSVHQGTPGKRFAGLKVVNDRGNRISFFQALIRSCVKFLPWELAHYGIWQMVFSPNVEEPHTLIVLIASNLLAIVYFVLPFLNRKRKSVHDFAAAAVVADREVSAV
ncbi:hypothetical protein GKZ89_08205 [Bacillus mangrovi]|uniref:RDD domain-containing protein n=1 Tax=Metabacillus mangrovi TaxID=1491830 RepID=A0A7X2V458_9BACI|nr:RDD family protein [Metabacillus mangrovi]MTH53397.1 hypothetical protein [Metabacillus mangrovi]